MLHNLFDILSKQFPVPDKPFLRTPDDRTLTYGDLLRRSAQLANALTVLGVGPGDRVAVQVQKSAEAILLYLACLRRGAVLLPLNTAYTRTELGYFITDSEPSLLVCDGARIDDFHRLALEHGVRRVEALDSNGMGSLTVLARQQPTTFTNFAAGADDLAAILYTSGTTGRSKGAMLSHGNLSSNALALASIWRFTQSDVLLHALPIFHTHGLFVAINVILAVGASILLVPRFDAHAVMRLMPHATVMMGVPTFYLRLLQHPGLGVESTRHIRLFISGSAPLLSETSEQWLQRTGHAILERYGMTETNMITSNPYAGLRLPGTVGLPLAEVGLRIVDPATGISVPTGNIGMIEVKGPNVFKGYWRNPEKTRTEFRHDGYFVTGDLGRYEEHGYIQIVGRSKDLIISGGYNIYPKEIEGEIDQLPGVAESAVIGVPHPDLGEGVVAIVVVKPEPETGPSQISEALENRLARFKLPKRIFVADELPRNAMGKVLKAILRDAHKETFI